MSTIRGFETEDFIRKIDAVKIIKNAKAELVDDYAYAAADLINPYIERMENALTVCHSKILDAFEKSIDPVHVAGACYCRECKHHDKSSCPAYDAPMNRTSLRITYCNCGERKQNEILD